MSESEHKVLTVIREGVPVMIEYWIDIESGENVVSWHIDEGLESTYDNENIKDSEKSFEELIEEATELAVEEEYAQTPEPETPDESDLIESLNDRGYTAVSMRSYINYTIKNR